jgi:hypothetical protein
MATADHSLESPAGSAPWSHVAAFGALWGSLEITLGAFLHVMRLPLVGVIMASMGAMLLVAARQVYPRRGTTLATGVVAALCKSISPGGIILGPMMGIATEGALVELALLAAPRSRACAVMAGVLCALWAAFQKLFMQVIFYGSDIIELYLAALSRAREWLALPLEAGWWALALLLLLLVFVGAAAGLLGRSVGAEAAHGLGVLAGKPRER